MFIFLRFNRVKALFAVLTCVFAFYGMAVSAAPHVKNLIVITYDPINPNNPAQRASDVYGWPDYFQMTTDLVNHFSSATQGHVQYQVINHHVIDFFPYFRQGAQYNWDDYAQCVSQGYSGAPCEPEGPRSVDYNRIATTDTGTDYCSEIAANNVDEIWVWSGFGTAFDEFAYKIPGDDTMFDSNPFNGWLYNWRRYNLPDCGRTYAVMGFVPQAGMANTMHSYGHRMESMISLSPAGRGSFVECGDVIPGQPDWTDFVCSAHVGTGTSGCGTIHFPPNGAADYDYENTTFEPSNCSQWSDYPNITSNTENVNRETWGQVDGNYHLGFMKYWMSNIPRADGQTNGVANDWWHYALNYENPYPTLNSTYPSVYFRGTPNSWVADPMSLVDDYLWEITIEVSTASAEFKFDIYGDWSLNFGDNNADGIVEQTGNNIQITNGPGTFTIQYNDQTGAYSIVKSTQPQAPVASINASPNPVFLGESIFFDASASSDADGSIVDYAWTGDVTASGINFNHTFAQAGNYSVTLTVTDNDGLTASETISVEVTDSYNQNYAAIYLAGSHNGWDADDAASALSLVGHNVWQATINLNAGGAFKFTVGDWSVSFGDNDGNGVADTNGGGDISVPGGTSAYLVTFNDDTLAYSVVEQTQPLPPVANAGADIHLNGPGTAYFDGTLSSDPDGSIVSYSWTSEALSYSLPGATPNYFFPSLGIFEVTLTVEDNDGLTDTDTVLVYVEQEQNQLPVAVAGDDQTVTVGASATIDASASYDPDGEIIYITWDCGSLGFFTGDIATLTFTEVGTYVCTLTVQDDEGATSTDTITFVVEPDSFASNYPSVYLRGTHNGWAADMPMTLVADNVWQVTATFSSSGQFKFDVYGDWSLNFGDNNSDGSLEQGGSNIQIPSGAGTYTIQLNDQTLQYSIAQ